MILTAYRKKFIFLKILQIFYPYPQAPSPREGAECGAAALTPLGATPQTPFFDSDRCFSTDLKNHDMILIIEEDNR